MHEPLETALFTQEELLYALDGLGEQDADDQEESYAKDLPVLSSSPLPEFPLRWQEEVDSLLGSEAGSEDWLEPSSDLSGTVDPSILDPPESELDENTFNLLEQLLGSLSLQPADMTPIEANENASDSSNTFRFDFDEEAMPPFLYCKPCDTQWDQPDAEPQGTNASIASENANQNNSVSFNTLGGDFEEEPIPPFLYCQPCDTQSDLPDIDSTNLDWIDEAQVVDEGQPVDYFKPRPEAMAATDQFVKAMGASDNPRAPQSERLCFGHKSRILGLDISECGKFMATASEDSTVKIWDVASNRLLATLDYNKKFECLRAVWAPQSWREEERNREEENSLRYLLATGSADGFVHLYSCSDPLAKPWVLRAKIDHSQLSHFAPTEDPDDKPQVYALQFIEDWKGLGSTGEQNSFLLTSSDDHVHLWEWDNLKRVELESRSSETQLLVDFREIISIKFSSLHGQGYGVRVGQVSKTGMFSLPSTVSRDEQQDMMPSNGDSTFGGERNPNGLTFVFDAQYNAVSGCLGVALSDGSLRILNGRGVCLSVLKLPGINSHLTSFAWDLSGRRLATCVASGHIITWNIEVHGSDVRASCAAIFENGHEAGRPLFGARYVDNHQHSEEILLSWGVDGRLCLWDAFAEGEAHGPLAILLARQSYPVYSVCLRSGRVGVGGGGSDSDFIGVPVYLYDF